MSEAQSDLRDVLPVGTVLTEYEVKALLGRGGFGVVYRARHVEQGHFVALKEYLPADLAVRDGGTVYPRSTELAPLFEDGKRRFLEESKRIVQFRNDPGVVACLGNFHANGTAYIVLEYVDGMSLAELLRKREAAGLPFDENELRSLVLPLLETLVRLHEADVLHRDIKPSNILIRRTDERPVLIDFGAAKQQTALQTKSNAPYTDGYAALEQVGKGELGPWTDIYAIGAVMWRVVAGGKPPWKPPNPKTVESRASAVLMDKPDPLPSAVELGRGRYSPNLLVAIDKCLKIRWTERVRNCDDLNGLINNIELARPHDGSVSRKLALGCIGISILIGSIYYILSYSTIPEHNTEFTVITNPIDATITFKNYSQPYIPGMSLPPGAYKIIVSSAGFQSAKLEVNHGNSPSTKHVKLERSIVHPIPPTSEKGAKFTVQVEPNNAQISLLDYPTPYKSGMILALGFYSIEVSADGFQSQKMRIFHSGPSPYYIELRKTVKPFTIDTDPLDAKIEILGIEDVYEHGIRLPPDNYHVRVSAPGYISTTVQVVHSNLPSRARVVLQPTDPSPKSDPTVRSASFVVDTEPVSANVVLLESSKEYKRGMNLDLGMYRIEVSANGFITRRTTIDHNGTGPHRITLNRRLATLIVHVDPQDARIELANSRFKYENNMPLPPGHYQVRVSAPGYKSKTIEVSHRQEPSIAKVSLAPRAYLRVGSTQDQVIVLHGTPSVVTRRGPRDPEIWHYGTSTIMIDPRSKLVVSWQNAGNLRVRPSYVSKVDRATDIRVGSDADDVVQLLGPPSTVIRYGAGRPETWHYGSSTVTVDPRTRRVVALHNGGKLRTNP